MFTLFKKSETSQKRIGDLATRRGVVPTPVFMPIATKGAVKSVLPDEIEKLGSKLILGNTYHLWLRPGVGIIKKAGGLHKFMDWPHSILTDSGGYQVFSLGEKIRLKEPSAKRLRLDKEKDSENHFRNHEIFPGVKNFIRAAFARSFSLAGEKTVPARKTERFGNDISESFLGGSAGFVKISDRGVEFRDPIDGKKYFLTPEKSIEIQLDLGSDIIMAFDECPPYPASKEQVAKAVKRTTEWAGRCKRFFDEKTSRLDISRRPLLFGIIQGGIFKDLREQSAREILEIGFDGYAIGGVAVGEPRESLKDILDWVIPMLPQDKPRYLMGLGKPEEIVSAVNAGIDMFDCVIPTREARHGRIYKFKKSGRNLEGIFYEALQIDQNKFKEDFSPIDEDCDCQTCREFSKAYLNHLFRSGEPLSLTLATIHNLKFYLEIMERLRQV